MKPIAVLGDSSNHGGTLISTGQDNKLTAENIPVCANGCNHNCPQFYDPPFNTMPHGVTTVVAVTVKSRVNGKLIITQGAVAGCGAIITPPIRGINVE